MCQEIGKWFEESLWERIKLVKNWEIVWIRNKTIMLKEAKYDVKNYADLGGCYPSQLQSSIL